MLLLLGRAVAVAVSLCVWQLVVHAVVHALNMQARDLPLMILHMRINVSALVLFSSASFTHELTVSTTI